MTGVVCVSAAPAPSREAGEAAADVSCTPGVGVGGGGGQKRVSEFFGVAQTDRELVGIILYTESLANQLCLDKNQPGEGGEEGCGGGGGLNEMFFWLIKAPTAQWQLQDFDTQDGEKKKRKKENEQPSNVASDPQVVQIQRGRHFNPAMGGTSRNCKKLEKKN